MTGITYTINFPTTPGAFLSSGPGGFVTKLNANGSAIVYAQVVGTIATGIAVDAAGEAYVIDEADNSACGNSYMSEWWKFNSDGTDVPSGGSFGRCSTYFHGIAVDSVGNAYVTGDTYDPELPVTSGAFQPKYGGGRLSAFVSKFGAGYNNFLYLTYLGGSVEDHGEGIAADAAGNAYVTGITGSGDFPTMNALQSRFGGGADAFVTKLNANGSALVYSTFLGGSGYDGG